MRSELGQDYKAFPKSMTVDFQRFSMDFGSLTGWYAWAVMAKEAIIKEQRNLTKNKQNTAHSVWLTGDVLVHCSEKKTKTRTGHWSIMGGRSVTIFWNV